MLRQRRDPASRRPPLDKAWNILSFSAMPGSGSKPVPQRLTTAERIRMGMSLVPEDRKRTGIFPISSVASNLTIASLWRRLQRGLTIATKKEEAVVASTIGAQRRQSAKGGYWPFAVNQSEGAVS